MSGSVGVDEIIAWFQNKVADYDLQIWERSVMRKELLEKLTVEGSRKSPVPEHLIDLDLVQGNSFPKAKPIEAGWRPWYQVMHFQPSKMKHLFLRVLCLQYLCQFMPLGGRRERQHFLHLFYYYFGLIRLLAYQHMLPDVDSYPAQ